MERLKQADKAEIDNKLLAKKYNNGKARTARRSEWIQNFAKGLLGSRST